MAEEDSKGKLRSFLIGGVVGASAAIAAARRAERVRRAAALPAGLAAFESAPCFHEALESGLGEERRGPA